MSKVSSFIFFSCLLFSFKITPENFLKASLNPKVLQNRHSSVMPSARALIQNPQSYPETPRKPIPHISIEQQLDEYTELLPPLEIYQKQVKAGLSVTSVSLLIATTAELMISAKQDLITARRFSRELSRCVTTRHEIPNSVRTYCFENLKSLKKTWRDSEITEIWRRSQKSLSASVLNLSKAIDLL